MLDYLTSLDQIKPGAEWPINADMAARFKKLNGYKLAFQGEHASVYNESFHRISTVIGNFNQVFEYGTILNYQKKISIKTADLLLGEQPSLRAEDEKKQADIDDIVKTTDLWGTVYEAAIDNSRFGNSVLMIYESNGKPKIDIIPTSRWIPVVDPMNIKNVTNHIIFWVMGEGESKELHMNIHSVGSYEVRVYKLKSSGYSKDRIGPLKHLETVNTGLSDFAIIPFSNLTTSDSIYGISDYDDVDSIVCEIEVRISQISKILDKHADPSVVVPEASVEIDPDTGEAKIRLGNAFIIDKDSPAPSYLTFDGKLEASFKQLELLLNQLAIISELGTLFLGNGLEKLGAISGTALKKLAYSALAKVSRIEKKMTPKILKTLELAGEIINKDLSDASIAWSDSLPTDLKEIVEIANLRTGNKPTMTTSGAIQYIEDKDRASADKLAQEIKEEDGGVLNGEGDS